MISRHKIFYYAERHLFGTFSAYVGKTVYDFADQFNPKTDCLNILECNGVPAGSIAIKKAGENTDKSEWGEGVIEEYWELSM